MNASINHYRVTGNTDPMRLGRIFRTGWTMLDDGTIAASTSHPNHYRGSIVESIGTIEIAEVIRRQVRR